MKCESLIEKNDRFQQCANKHPQQDHGPSLISRVFFYYYYSTKEKNLTAIAFMFYIFKGNILSIREITHNPLFLK